MRSLNCNLPKTGLFCFVLWMTGCATGPVPRDVSTYGGLSCTELTQERNLLDQQAADAENSAQPSVLGELFLAALYSTAAISSTRQGDTATGSEYLNQYSQNAGQRVDTQIKMSDKAAALRERSTLIGKLMNAKKCS